MVGEEAPPPVVVVKSEPMPEVAMTAFVDLGQEGMESPVEEVDIVNVVDVREGPRPSMEKIVLKPMEVVERPGNMMDVEKLDMKMKLMKMKIQLKKLESEMMEKENDAAREVELVEMAKARLEQMERSEVDAMVRMRLVPLEPQVSTNPLNDSTKTDPAPFLDLDPADEPSCGAGAGPCGVSEGGGRQQEEWAQYHGHGGQAHGWGEDVEDLEDLV